MAGFFPSGNSVSRCRSRCKLYQTCDHPQIPPSGKGERKVLFIGETPCPLDDQLNSHFNGPGGQVLRNALAASGFFDLERDGRSTYAVRCLPPKDRNPVGDEVDACRPHIWKEIEEFQPKVIVLLGGVALDAFIGDRWRKGIEGVARWRGFAIPDRKARAWVVPTFSPDYVQRMKYDPSADLYLRQDIDYALSLTDVPFPKLTPEQEKIIVVTERDDILEVLAKAHTRPWLAFDYETTGLKPHRPGHDILTCAISWNSNRAYAFPMHDPKVRAEWIQVLRNKAVGKIAHNIKFEQAWSQVILGQTIRGPSVDTIIRVHLQDCRSKITSLKFQSAVRWGIYDYDSEMSKFIGANDEEQRRYGNNAFNSMRKAPLKRVLVYNGMDSMLEYRLWRETNEDFGMEGEK